MIQPTHPSAVKAWCRQHGFQPNRTLGQNFLIDGNSLNQIVTAAELSPGSQVLEVGPGLGALTEALLATGAAVTAVEKDHRLAAWLREWLGNNERFSLIEGDMLQQPLDTLLRQPESGQPRFDATVSNLPYISGTRIVLDLCRHPAAPHRLVVTLQREVAERLAAAPGTAARSLAGVWVQQNHHVSLLRNIKPSCFWPRPEVASTVVMLERHNDEPLTPPERHAFDVLTRHAFSQRRKQIAVAMRYTPLKAAPGEQNFDALLAAAKVVPSHRAEMLTNAEWARLARLYTAITGEQPS